MASSGNFQDTFKTGYTLRVEWETNSQNVSNNTSSITVTAYLVSGGSSYTISSSASKTITLTINGTKYTKSAEGLANLSGNQKKNLFSKTVTVTHASDGSKSVAISCSFGLAVTLSGTYISSASTSGTAVLNTIPRATTPTTSGTFNVGSTVTISTPRASSAFTHTLQYSTNNSTWYTMDKATGVGTSYSWAIPATLATAIPGAKTGTVYIRCITYNGSTNIGSKTITRSYTVTSAYAAPSVSLTYSQTNSANLIGNIRGKSTITIKASGTFKHSATAKTYVFTYGGTSKTVTTTASSASVSFALPVNAPATYNYSVTLTDSRGFTATANSNFGTVAYAAPDISSFNVVRGDYDGTTFTKNDRGANLKITAAGSITSLTGNVKNYKLEYRLSSATAYTTLVNTKAVSAYAFSITEYTGAIFDYNSAYVIRLSVTDSFGAVSQIFDLPTQKVMLNFSGDGKCMAIGGIASTEDAVEIMTQLYCTGGIKPITLPTGTNLDEIVKTGLYVGSMNTQDMLNSPMETGSFTLEVTSAGTSGQLMQRYSYCHKTTYRAFVRFMYEGAWGAWQPAEGFTSFSISSHSGRVRFANGFLIQWGRVSITPTAANTITSQVIKFPVAYTSSPICQVSANSAAPNILTCSYTADADELTLSMTRTNTTATWISWTAFGISN